MIRKIISVFTESEQTFKGQQSGEEVIAILRKHHFTVILPISLCALFALAPILFWIWFPQAIEDSGLASLFWFLTSLWLLGAWIMAFYQIMMYLLNTVIITNTRIIENEQRSFFNRQVAELHIYRVQDVLVHTEGLVRTFLDYGDIVVQTAASEKQFVFDRIAEPEKIKDTIMQAVASRSTGVRPLPA